MIQQAIILIIFLGAVCYLGYLFYKTFHSKGTECGGNCGCSKVDLKKIEEDIQKKESIQNSKLNIQN